jgi:hypothetical protein
LKIESDPKLLVRTWLHDEGELYEVVELSRDLLFVCNIFDDSIWFQLIHHMLEKKQHRSLFSTLIMINKLPIFSRICFGLFGGEIISVLSDIVSDSVDRIDQVVLLNLNNFIFISFC